MWSSLLPYSYRCMSELWGDSSYRWKRQVDIHGVGSKCVALLCKALSKSSRFAKPRGCFHGEATLVDDEVVVSDKDGKNMDDAAPPCVIWHLLFRFRICWLYTRSTSRGGLWMGSSTSHPMKRVSLKLKLTDTDWDTVPSRRWSMILTQLPNTNQALFAFSSPHHRGNTSSLALPRVAFVWCHAQTKVHDWERNTIPS